MKCRSVSAGVLLLAGFCGSVTAAQPGNRRLDTKAVVLDQLFPLDVAPEPYHLKLILRFSESDSQITVVVYPGGKSEVIVRSLANMKQGELARRIQDLAAANSAVSPSELAATLSVDSQRSLLDGTLLNRSLKRLEAIRISPALPTVSCMDACSQYEFWYDTWQDTVHYALTSPEKGPRHELVQWMIKFKDTLPTLIRSSSEPGS